MGFTGAGATDEDRIALGIQECAGGEFAHLPFIDRRIGENERVATAAFAACWLANCSST